MQALLLLSLLKKLDKLSDRIDGEVVRRLFGLCPHEVWLRFGIDNKLSLRSPCTNIAMEWR
ncbi:MAG: hypothetical protein UFP03_08050, partial [Paludibacteraceae bacterium]|nr:hypothetical protein [Paludibacteraceae bacterium]